MIITSVLAGPKKYKTATLDFLPFPLVWSTGNKFQFAYRGHKTFNRPFFNVNMNTPVEIPLDFGPPTPGIVDGLKYQTEEYTAASENEGSADETGGESAGEQENPTQEDQSMNMNMNLDSQAMDVQKQHEKYTGHDASHSSSTPRPYTGKAQVSSFIDNGQFVNAHNQVPAVKPGNQNQGAMTHQQFGEHAPRDAVFSDEANTAYNLARRDIPHLPFSSMFPSMRSLPRMPDFSSLFNIAPHDQFSRRLGFSKPGKTISLGYDIFGEPPSKDHATLHNRHPDSMPWAMGYEGLQKYYNTFTFTDGFRDPSKYISIEEKSPFLQKILSWL